MGTNIQLCFTCLSTDLKFIRFENIDRNIAAFYERFVADGSDTVSKKIQFFSFISYFTYISIYRAFLFVLMDL